MNHNNVANNNTNAGNTNATRRFRGRRGGRHHNNNRTSHHNHTQQQQQQQQQQQATHKEGDGMGMLSYSTELDGSWCGAANENCHVVVADMLQEMSKPKMKKAAEDRCEARGAAPPPPSYNSKHNYHVNAAASNNNNNNNTAKAKKEESAIETATTASTTPPVVSVPSDTATQALLRHSERIRIVESVTLRLVLPIAEAVGRFVSQNDRTLCVEQLNPVLFRCPHGDLLTTHDYETAAAEKNNKKKQASRRKANTNECSYAGALNKKKASAQDKEEEEEEEDAVAAAKTAAYKAAEDKCCPSLLHFANGCVTEFAHSDARRKGHAVVTDNKEGEQDGSGRGPSGRIACFDKAATPWEILSLIFSLNFGFFKNQRGGGGRNKGKEEEKEKAKEQEVPTVPWKNILDASGHFCLLFHGTSDASRIGSIFCEGFDPTRRSGQVCGRGEYFGVSHQHSQSYTGGTQRMFVVLAMRHRVDVVSTGSKIDNPIPDKNNEGAANGVAFQFPLAVVSLAGAKGCAPGKELKACGCAAVGNGAGKL